QRCLNSTRARESDHSPLVTTDQGAFTGSHGDIKQPLSMLAVHQHRAGDSHRDLRRANRVLDIAAKLFGLERDAADVLEGCAGLLLDPGAAARYAIGVIPLILEAR